MNYEGVVCKNDYVVAFRGFEGPFNVSCKEQANFWI